MLSVLFVMVSGAQHIGGTQGVFAEDIGEAGFELRSDPKAFAQAL